MYSEEWPFVLCGFLCLHTSYVLADLERVCTSATYARGTHSQGICGSSLSDTISLVCGGAMNVNILNSKRHTRRWHYSHHWYGKRDTKDVENKLAESNTRRRLGNILLGKKEAKSFLHKRSAFGETGIVCECCYHSCSYYELTQYCISQPPSFFKRKRSIPEPDVLD